MEIAALAAARRYSELSDLQTIIDVGTIRLLFACVSESGVNFYFAFTTLDFGDIVRIAPAPTGGGARTRCPTEARHCGE